MKSNNSVILITGAGGWLGSELTKQLLERGNNVRALNFNETESLKNLKEKYNDRLEIVLGDICNIEVIKQSMQQVDVVYHLAAKVHSVPTNKKEEEIFYKVNSDATKVIFEQALENNVKRIIFFSTVSVYKQSNEEITTNSLKEPNTIYGKSKLKAEMIANKLYKEKNLPVTIIEPVTVYGEGDVGNFKKLEKLAQKGICVKLGNGNNKKTVIYYKDLITMVIQITNDDKTIGKTIICGTEVLTINKINEILTKKVNKRIFKIYIPRVLTKFIIKICSFSVLKKIKRKVMALTQSNEFKIEYKINEYTKFEDYELKEISNN